MSILTPGNPTLGQRALNATQSAHPELWRGLVGAWNSRLGFQGHELRDFQSGPLHPATIESTPQWSPEGWLLDGDDYAHSVFPGTPLDGFTVIARVKPTTLSGDSRSIVMHGTKNDSNWHWRLQLNRDGSNKVNWRTWEFGSKGSVNSQTAITTNRWWSIACIHDDASDRDDIYINGTLDQTGNLDATDNINSSNEDLVFGAWQQLNNDFFIGIIGEIYLYERVLADTEILRHHLTPHAPFRLADDTAMLAALSDTGGTAVDAAMALASRRARVSSSAGVDVQSNSVLNAAPSAAELDGLIDVAGDAQSVAQQPELKAGAIVDIEGVVESTSDKALASIGADVQVTGTVDAVSDEGEVDSLVDVAVTGGASIVAAEARIVGDVIEITVDPNQPATPSQRVIVRVRSRTFRPDRESRTFRPRSGGNTYKPEP